MTIGSYTYGTVAGIHRRIGWVVPSKGNFTANTEPSITDVEQALDDVAAEIHAKLLEAGYPVSTKAVVSTAAPRAVAWLQSLNEAGASALLLQGFPVAGDSETAENKPEAFFKKVYENGLKLIVGVFLDRAGLTRDHALSEFLVCTSILNEDGEEKLPMFKRDMWDDPGTGELVEDE